MPVQPAEAAVYARNVNYFLLHFFYLFLVPKRLLVTFGYCKEKDIFIHQQEGTRRKHSYQMETISVPSRSQTEKKVGEILQSMIDNCKLPCPVKDVLHSVGDKWSMLVMMVLGQAKTLRFNELKTVIIGISQKMLTVTLKNLERHGLVARKMYPQIPPKVEYTITPLGEGYLQHFVVMLTWACENLSTISKTLKKTAKK